MRNIERCGLDDDSMFSTKALNESLSVQAVHGDDAVLMGPTICLASLRELVPFSAVPFYEPKASRERSADVLSFSTVHGTRKHPSQRSPFVLMVWLGREC
jgi:hypothetical protein